MAVEIQCQHGYIYIQYYIHYGYIYIGEPGHCSWREGSYVRTCTVIHDAACDATAWGQYCYVYIPDIYTPASRDTGCIYIRVDTVQKLLCGGRKTENLIEPMCFYLKISRVHVFC